METQVEELADNKVRLIVEVPSGDVRHAVEHAASDLAASVRVPGFRKGKVPLPVLIARVGRERLFSEAIEGHIGRWFRSAAARSRIHPVEQPEYGYDLPSSAQEDWTFTATVAVQPRPVVADWTKLEVPRAEEEVPAELVERELEALRSAVAELAPVEGRPAREGDTVVVDLVNASGEAQRDYVVELASGLLADEVEVGIVGMSAGDTKEIELERAGGETGTVEVTVKEIKEKVPSPLDDELARAASEFDTLAELRASIEARLREQLEEEVESAFRAAALDALVEASKVEASGPLVEARAAELWNGFVRSLARRGLSAETYFRLTGQDAAELEARLLAEAAQAVARELVLEAVADELGLQVSDDEVRALIREQAEAAGDDPEETVELIWQAGRQEGLREDLRLRSALDRVAAEVKPIPVELARAREKLWTPEKEKTPADTKLWTPGSKEPA